MDVDLAFDTNTTVGEFMAMVSTHRKKKKNQAKTVTREKEWRSLITRSFTTLSAIIVQEAEEYKTCNMQKINKSKEKGREMKKPLMKKLRQSWMCCSMQ